MHFQEPKDYTSGDQPKNLRLVLESETDSKTGLGFKIWAFLRSFENVGCFWTLWKLIFVFYILCKKAFRKIPIKCSGKVFKKKHVFYPHFVDKGGVLESG